MFDINQLINNKFIPVVKQHEKDNLKYLIVTMMSYIIYSDYSPTDLFVHASNREYFNNLDMKIRSNLNLNFIINIPYEIVLIIDHHHLSIPEACAIGKMSYTNVVRYNHLGALI